VEGGTSVEPSGLITLEGLSNLEGHAPDIDLTMFMNSFWHYNLCRVELPDDSLKSARVNF